MRIADEIQGRKKMVKDIAAGSSNNASTIDFE